MLSQFAFKFNLCCYIACAELMPHLRVTPLVPEFAATHVDQRDYVQGVSEDYSGTERQQQGMASGAPPVVPLTIIRAIVLIESLPAVGLSLYKLNLQCSSP